jgi:DNA-binding MarR family transcriptional regulator
MRSLLILAALLLPTASAQTFDAGPVHVEVQRDQPAPCFPTPDLPCLAWHDPGPSEGIADDIFHIEQNVHAVVVRADTDVLPPTAVIIDVANASVPNDLFPRLHDAHEALAPIAGPVFAEVDADPQPDGIHMRFPQAHDDGTYEFRRELRYLWYDPIVNYTHVHVPYKVDTRGTDYFIEGMSEFFGCPLSEHIGDAACISAGGSVIRSTQEVLPNVVFGAELHQARADIGDPTLAEPTSEQAAGRGSASSEAPFAPIAPAEASLVPVGALARVPGAPAAALPQEIAVFETSSASVETLALQHPATSLAIALLLLTLPLALYALFHRIQGSRVIEHPTRHRIREHLREHPGCGMADLAHALSLDFKTVSHHVSVLARAGFVSVLRDGRDYVLCLRGEETRAQRAALLAHPVRQGVMQAVHDAPGLRQSDLARKLGVSRSALHPHVRQLLRSGVLFREGSSLFAVDSAPEAPALTRAEA